MKILIISRTFNFHIYFRRNTVCPFKKSAYIHLAVKLMDILIS
jgi:hypothetical protein